jgi:branched-chain amino acid transport system permease protein
MLQIAINTIVSVSHLLLIGIALNLIYSTSRFLDISLAGTLVLVCYAFYFCINHLDLPLPISLILSFGSGIAAGVALHLLCGSTRKLTAKAYSPLSLLIASLGVYVVLQNALALSFGYAPQTVRWGFADTGHRVFRDIYLSNVQLVTMVIGCMLSVAVLVLIYFTQLGKSIRAITSDPDLAVIVGINVRRLRLFVVAIGTFLGAVAGLLLALDTTMTPGMGFRLLLNGLIVMIIGGVGSTRGLVGGAFVLAVAQNFSAYYLGSKWMDAVSFALLIGFLVWKPFGFSERRHKKVAV